ncbi:hypothetical protein ACM39_11850 [Chryseobacterium sp. FH2]|nr:hypothetical protein ACM39_11850 [Chryseobacterium sp. FH2]
MKESNWIFYLIAFSLFGIILPVFSMDFEIQKTVNGQPFVDNFTLIYTYFRFPVWWLMGIFEVFYLKYIIKH